MPHRIRMLLPAIALVLLATTAPANPLPPAFLFFHVQPLNQEFCEQNPIETCEQIVQYTEETGWMEADLFLMPIDPVIRDATFEVEWSQWWGESVGFENCIGGICVETPMGNRLQLQWVFEPPLEIDPSAPILLGRIGVVAEDPGEVWLDSGSMTGENWTEVVGGSGLIGVDECYCFTSCETFGPACGASFDDPDLYLEAPKGEVVEGVLNARLRYGPDFQPCPVNFAEDQECCELSVVYDEPDIEVTVTVDTRDLPVGEHAFNVRSESECVDCARVHVNVLEPSGIPEDTPSLTRTWGRVRSDFR
ncbi:MAG: hypothetical protein GF346_01560 [Candidatus Eisenbacteria bacterium]|nr:hypothetical protein [Candidatus Latescibacterota bacterium]MBD3301117.1 hypothetical protein [Candidatus Eisenbacteria bacterium]